MKLRNSVLGLILIILGLALVTGCEPPRSYSVTPVTPSYYYVVPASSYLRDCPSYDCGIVAQVFSGDRIEILDRNDMGWARGRLDRSGVVGWIPGDLLSSGPSGATFYVATTNIYLRECADYNCRQLELLYRGDRVDKIDQDYKGWWRVISQKSRKAGWIPASAVSTRPGAPYYYVAISSLNLRAGPSQGSRTLTSLPLNTQVEFLNMGSGGWAQVRELPGGMIGWVAFRYLETFPVSRPRATPPKRKAAPSQKDEPAEPPAKAPKAM